MKNKDRLIQRLKSVLALAREGVDGEKRNAEELLEAMLLKHGLKIEDIEGEKKSFKRFEVRKDQDYLFRRIVDNVIGGYRYKDVETRWSYTSKIFVCCTKTEYAEIILKFDFYFNLWMKEIETFQRAFVWAQDLWSKQDPAKTNEKDEYIDTRTPEEKERDRKTLSMMQGIEKATLHKRIGKLETNESEA